MAKEDQENCIFCKIIAGESPLSEVYSDEHCIGLMTIGPVNEGHVMVIPREHLPYLKDVPEKLGAHMFTVAQRLAAAIRSSDIPCDGINMFLADGEVAHQEVFHFHLHVYPRLEGDGFGFKYDERHFQEPPRSELDRVAKVIRNSLDSNNTSSAGNL